MLKNPKMHSFHVLAGEAIGDLLNGSTSALIETVAQAYLAHEAGQTTNPDSYFLRFPQDDSRRIIALPAAIHGDQAVSGIKWIASYPGNLSRGLQRASAVLVLNDPETGYPIALLEGARISAARTAASAVLGAYWLNARSRRTGTLSLVGGGYIARNIAALFKGDGWDIERVIVHDVDQASAQALAGFVESHTGYAADVGSLDEALAADVVTFATNAIVPYVLPPRSFAPGQIVLNISLRDIAPELVLASQNVFDDVSHCLKANTSPHLAEQMVGHQEFVTGTIAGVIRGDVTISQDKPVIYSPFGMGILDLAVARQLLATALAEGRAIEIPNFLGDMSRW
jgi:2,3-diaminopropionate biosynthesis protein SbnB